MDNDSSRRLVPKLKLLVNSIGPVKVAYKLGEWDTQNLKRWIRTNKIPQSKTKQVERFINQPLKAKLNRRAS